MGQTSSSCAMRRMLSAFGPSWRARSTAASRMRSRERGSRLACSAIVCTLYTTAYTDGGGQGLMRRTVRSLAWFTIAAQAAFVVSWLVAAARQPDYSHARSAVSALAAHGMRDPWIVMAGMTLLGLSAIALA